MKRRIDFSRGSRTAPRLGTTADLARWQLKLLTAFDLVPKKLESLPDVHDPRLLRMGLCTPQFVQGRIAASLLWQRVSSADSQVTTQSSAYLVS